MMKSDNMISYDVNSNTNQQHVKSSTSSLRQQSRSLSDNNDGLSRLQQDQELLSRQSLPTLTTPTVMETKVLFL